MADRINRELMVQEMDPLPISLKYSEAEGLAEHTGLSVSDWAGLRFEAGRGMLFIGACGIAVRGIASHVRDKLEDPPVIVMDDNGNYVIPILSGHVGNANKDAVFFAGLLGALPVITTSTDVNDVFSADVFAMENHLKIMNRDGIRRVSARAIAGKAVTLSIRDYPPKEPVDVIVSDEDTGLGSLWLSPGKYAVGVGLKKDLPFPAFEAFLLQILKGNQIPLEDVGSLCSIDIKADEPALRKFSVKYRIPLLTFSKEMLNRAEGEFASSDFVLQTVGVDNVCERAAIAGTGYRGSLILRKTAGEGMTVAVAKKG